MYEHSLSFAIGFEMIPGVEYFDLIPALEAKYRQRFEFKTIRVYSKQHQLLVVMKRSAISSEKLVAIYEKCLELELEPSSLYHKAGLHLVVTVEEIDDADRELAEALKVDPLVRQYSL